MVYRYHVGRSGRSSIRLFNWKPGNYLPFLLIIILFICPFLLVIASLVSRNSSISSPPSYEDDANSFENSWGGSTTCKEETSPCVLSKEEKEKLLKKGELEREREALILTLEAIKEQHTKYTEDIDQVCCVV
jgi:hypothetical protein